MDPILRKQLIRDEGYRLDAYKDSLGFWTIGIGHYLGTRKRMTDITREEADALFAQDVLVAEDLCGLIFGGAEGARRRAFTNMAFNIGGRLWQFKRLIAAVNAQNWEQAAKEMLASKWATQVGARAERLANVIRTGIET